MISVASCKARYRNGVPNIPEQILSLALVAVRPVTPVVLHRLVSLMRLYDIAAYHYYGSVHVSMFTGFWSTFLSVCNHSWQIIFKHHPPSADHLYFTKTSAFSSLG
jgi:hypothetical protein